MSTPEPPEPPEIPWCLFCHVPLKPERPGAGRYVCPACARIFTDLPRPPREED